MSISFLWLYDFSTATTEPPTSSQVRLDTASYPEVTKLWARYFTSDGIDNFLALMALLVGTSLYLQDKNDHALGLSVKVAAAPIDKGGYVEIPVTYATHLGALNNNQAVALIELLSQPVGPEPEPPEGIGGPLITLDEAKRHLREEWTTANDADIQAKADAASAILRDYLQARNDPAWTPALVPLPLKSATLLILGHLYARNRGDDPETDEALWAAVHRLVIRFRDPAYA